MSVQRKDYSITIGTAFDIGPAEVPQMATAVKAVDCRIYEFQLCNTSNAEVTAAITDGNDLAFIPTTTLAAEGGTISFASNRGRSMPGGIKWVASATGVVGFITGIA